MKTKPSKRRVSERQPSHRIHGQVVFAHGEAASDLYLRVYHCAIGGETKLVGKGRTDGTGRYEIICRTSGPLNATVHAHEGKREIALSRSVIVTSDTKVDLVAPTSLRPPRPEFARLITAVESHLPSEQLEKVVEGRGRRDLTLLSTLTGWDPGHLTLAAAAFATTKATGISVEALYGLYRTGLPAAPRRLARTSSQEIAAALERAVNARLIDPSVVKLGREAFARFASHERLEGRLPSVSSNITDFVRASKISKKDQDLFLSVLARELSADLWKAADAEGVSKEAVTELRLQGKLAYLTLNHLGLASRLQEILAGAKSQDPRDLIAQDFDGADRWTKEVLSLAHDDVSTAARGLPTFVGGKDAADRIATYADVLAERVRAMAPHRVTARRLERGELDAIPEHERADASAVLKILMAHGYELGRRSLSSFKNHLAESQLPTDRKEKALRHIKALHRLHSISPTDDVANKLMKMGLTSATKVASIPRVSFVKTMADKLGSEAVARQVHQRAQRVADGAREVLFAAKRLRRTIAPRILTGTRERLAATVSKSAVALIRTFPTLERIFGSVDFCECDDCSSVLSPAAYYVDLLHFIDQRGADWTNAISVWDSNHPGTAGYVALKYLQPFQALTSRRPDLPLIPLTCENTNTELPYIDLVNELLETQVMQAAGIPAAVSAFDTGDATSADLIAEPAHINWDAYAVLAKAVYPRSMSPMVSASSPGPAPGSLPSQVLPFDLPLETLRELLSLVNLSVLQLRETFAYPDKLVGDSTYPGLLDVWYEKLGLCPADVGILTCQGDWFALYGYATEEDALQGIADSTTGVRDLKTSLRNAKTLATRLGITYDGVADLLRTIFVNTAVDKRDALYRLGLRPELVDKSLNGTLQGQDATTFAAELKQAALAYPTLTAGWLTGQWSQAVQQSLLILDDSAESSDFSDVELRFVVSPDQEPAAMALALLRMNIFVRLRDRLVWSNGDLDAILGAFLPTGSTSSLTDLGPAMAYGLSYIAHLLDLAGVAKGSVTTQELATLWAPIQTVGFGPLYTQLFLDPTLLIQDRGFDDPIGGYLQSTNTTVTMAAHAAAVRQVLQLSDAEIGLVLASGADTTTDTKVPAFTLNNLSMLLRASVLSRVLGISIANLYTLMGLSGHHPLKPLNPPPTPPIFPTAPAASIADDVPFAETIPFVTDARQLAAFGFDANRLDALCRANPSASDLATTSASVDRLFITTMGVVSANADAPDVRLGVVRAVAAAQSIMESLANALLTDVTLLKSDSGGAILDTLVAGPTEGFFAGGTAASPTQMAIVMFPAPGSYTFALSVAQSSAVQISLGDTTDPTAFGSLSFGTTLSGAATFPDVQPGILYTLTLDGLSGTVAGITVQGDHLPQSSLDVLNPTGYDAFVAFSKATQHFLLAIDILQAFGLDERTYGLAQTALGQQALDLSSVPVDPPTDATVPTQVFAGLASLAAVANAAASLSVAPSTVLTAQIAADQLRAQGTAASSAPLDKALLLVLSGKRPISSARARQASSLVASQPPSPTTARTKMAALLKFARAARFSAAADIDPNVLRRWSLSGLTATFAQQAHDITKALFSKDSWRGLAQPIYDVLRKQQRDALVAYLTASPGAPYSTQDQLYEFLLVDPGSEPPLLTSRLQLAISSVQLFVQRCLMNFELSVPRDIINADRWSWMSRNSLWVANRKIFLWPENWLDPALRDDKTPLFTTLESTLIQGDTSIDAVEGALNQYLQGLETIARLEMMTMYRDVNVSGTETMHVIGRTLTPPYKYYYRRYADSLWTPWEPCGLSIDGSHTVLTMWHDRLHVFWVTFVPQAAAKSPATIDASNDTPTFTDLSTKSLSDVAPTRVLQLQLNWAELFAGKWMNQSNAGPYDVSTYLSNLPSGYADLSLDVFFVHVDKVVAGADASAEQQLEFTVTCYYTDPAAKEETPQSVRFTFANKSSSPTVESGEPPSIDGHLSATTPWRTKWQGSDHLDLVNFNSDTVVDVTAAIAAGSSSAITRTAFDYPLLTTCPSPFRLLLPSNPPLPGGSSPLPIPAGTLSGYQDALGQVQYITYRGTDGHIYEVWGEGRSPTGESFWYLTDITAAANAVAAASDPVAFAMPGYPGSSLIPPGSRYLVCVGEDGHLYFFVWDTTNTSWTSAGWTSSDLTLLTGVNELVGRPALVLVSYTSALPLVYVWCRDINGKLNGIQGGFDMYQPLSLQVSGPLAASDPRADGYPGANQIVAYRDEQNHIQCLVFAYVGQPKTLSTVDLTSTLSLDPVAGAVSVGASPGDLSNSDPLVGYQVVYRSALDGSVHLLSGEGPVNQSKVTSWTHRALNCPPSAGDFSLWYRVSDPRSPSLHFVYRAQDGSVIECWNDGAGDQSQNVTTAAGAPLAAGDPVAYRFDRFGCYVLAYETVDGGLCVLERVPTGAWQPAGPIPLSQTDLEPTDADQLRLPFFFEDDKTTFYVEPSLEETLTHEWQSYVGTANAQRPVPPRDARPLVARFPSAKTIEAGKGRIVSSTAGSAAYRQKQRRGQ